MWSLLRQRRPGRDPRQNSLDILIREVLQPSIRGPPGIVFPQHVRDRILPQPGEIIRIAPDPAATHLFDAETGRRLH